MAVAAAAVALCVPFVRSAELLTARGEWVTGDAAAAEGRVTLHSPGVGRAEMVPVEQLIALRFAAGPSFRLPCDAVELAGGDRLHGVVGVLDGDGLDLRHEGLGRLRIPRPALSAVVFASPPSGGGAPERPSAPAALLLNGDLVPGAAESITRDRVVLRAGEVTRSLPRDRCARLWLASDPAGARFAVPTSTVQRVRLANGDCLSGRLISLDARELALAPPWGSTMRIPLRHVAEVWSEGPAVVPLSLLEPASVVQVPQFDEQFPWQRDLSVSGGVLSVGGRPLSRGLGCYPRCELSWPLDRAFSRWVAEAALDDGSRPGATAEFVVETDGRVVFRSGPVRAGAAAVPVSVDVSGCRTLRLIVDFGPDGVSFGAHADWGRAVLVR